MIRRLLTKYYKRDDREFICGLTHTLLIALFLFALFKVADYFVHVPLHAHEHFGLLCAIPLLSWLVQAFAFMGVGLFIFFFRLWRKALAEAMSYGDIKELTEALQSRDAQLQRERARFKQVVDLQMEYVNKHLPDGTLTFVNKALYEILGFDSWEPLEGVVFYDYLEEPDKERLRQLHDTLTPENPRFYDMQRMKIKGGRTRWVEWQNCGIFNDDGSLRKVLAVGRDVTDRYIMETQLRDSEMRFRNLFDNMIAGFAVHVIVCRLNPDTGVEEPCDYHFIDVNPAFETMFGFTRDQVVGRTVLEIMPNTEPSLIARFGHVADTGMPDRFRCHFMDIKKWFEVTAFSNQPGQFAATFLDITTDRAGKRERQTDKEAK